MFKKSLLLMLLMAMFMPYAAQAQETLTVCDGTTTNSKIPVNGLYVDTQGTTSEFIIPAETTGMSDMEDGTISKVTFYINQIPGTWGSPTIQLYIGEVEGTTLSAINGPSSFTIVNTSVWSNQSSTIEVEFDAPYTYNGGNLLIGTYVQTKSSTYKTTNFDGAEAASGASRYNNGSGSGTAAAFLPKTTFTYTPNPYKKPVNLDYANIDPTSTEVTWEAPITSETIAGYLYSFKKTSDTDWPTTDEFTTDDHIVLDALEAGTSYDFRVKTDYTSEQSGYATISFTTLEACMTPENLQITNVLAHSATLTWTEGFGTGTWKLGYKTSTDSDYTLVDVVEADLPYTLSGLTAETTYNVIVYPLCDETKSVTGSFTTTIACPAPTALAVTLTPGDGTVATFNWTENGSATAWELCLDDDETNLIPMGTNPFTYDQFTPEQTYTAKMRAVCGGADGESAWSNTITFTPTDAYFFTVNEGTSTNEYVPFYGYYADSNCKGLFIIPATSLAPIQWGTINQLTFYVSGPENATFTNSSGVTAEFEVYMAETTNTTFSTTNIDFADMTKVMNQATINISNYKLEITLDQPYYYFGGNLMIGFNEPVSGGYAHTYWYGVAATGASLGGYGTTIGQKDFLPKTTFYYTPGTAPTCNMPTGLEVVGTPEAHKVVLQWTETGTASEWQLCLNGDETNPINVTENPYTLEGIASDTDFTVKVRAYCSDSDQSPWTPEISFHTAVACEKPTNLVITYNGGDTAEVSWDSESTITNFNIDVNGVVKAITGNTYSLTDLQLATTYTVKVQSDCGGGEVSAWVSDSFTTDLCMPDDMCEVTIKLTDAYSDGGGEIQVVDKATNTVLGTYTNSGAASEYTLSVCDGRELEFVFASTDSWPYENGYVISDVEGNVIAEHTGCTSSGACTPPTNGVIATYTVACPACPAPKNLAASNITINSADLSWEANSDSYVLQYRPWYPAGEDMQPTSSVMTNATFDLSGFTGTGSVVIRHYNSYNQFALIVDDIVVTNASGDAIFEEDFESCGGVMPTKFSNMDIDGDGFVWEIAHSIAVASPGMNVTGNYGLASYSYDNNTGTELSPDNWLVINNIPMGGEITFTYCAQDAGFLAETFCVYVSTESSIVEVPLTDKSYAATGLEVNTPYAWQVKGICGSDESSWGSDIFQTLNDVIIFQTDGDWNDAANWDVNRVPTVDDKVQIDAAAIINAGEIAYAKTTKVTDGYGYIYIADGGQLKQGTPTINVTVEKIINGHDTIATNGGWNLIATPVGTTLFASTAPGWAFANDLNTGNFDLYSFDATQEGNEWYNYQAHTSDFTKLFANQGYLYANEDTTYLNFVGTTPVKSLNHTVEVDFVYDATSTTPFNGFVLLGNPFTCNAYLTFTPEASYTPSSDVNFYVMNADGTDFELANRPLKVAEGAFFYGEGNGTIKISTEAPTKSNGMLNMTLTKDNANVSQARVRFGEGQNLKHLSFRENSSKLYIPQNEKEYAVVYADNQGEMPLCFKAETNGNYTISFNSTDVEFGYLHLIDNMTGADVDLLATPSYSFDAKYTDYASRFKLVFATGNTDDSFAFIGNGEIILSGVNGNTTVQLFDVTGRMISSTNGANSIAIDNMAAGVYMIRLVNGDNVKTQKIIVK